VVLQVTPQPLPRRLVLRHPHAQDLGDGRYDQLRLEHRRQRNEGDAGERSGSIGRHPQGEPRLAGAAGSGERDEAHVGTP
jgi:hypothetical protein